MMQRETKTIGLSEFSEYLLEKGRKEYESPEGKKRLKELINEQTRGNDEKN